jgi:cytochrome b pre-mRNA-processing protein 3
MILSRLFRKQESPARPLYEAIVAAARHPVPYASWQVPDTVQGRFDMIILHLFLVLGRLKGEDDALAQTLVDDFFADMDRSLREMGVADISVGKKVRKMAEATYGRLLAYEKAADAGAAELAAAIARNLFPDGGGEQGSVRVAAYSLSERTRLKDVQLPLLRAGKPGFSEPMP